MNNLNRVIQFFAAASLLAAFGAGCAYIGSSGPSPAPRALSNAKVLGICLVMYATDNDDRFPESSRWMDRLMPYAKGNPIFSTPYMPTEAWSMALSASTGGMNTKAEPHPDKRIAAFTTSVHVRNAAGGYSIAWNPPPKTFFGTISRGSCTAVDGHAKLYNSRSQLLAFKW